MGLKETILEKARKFVEKGQLEKGIAEYRHAAEVDPKDVSIRLRIGDIFVKMGREEDAVKEYMDVAKANTQRGFYLKAIAVYKQVLKLDAANIDVHNKLAELYTKQRLIVDAISEYSYLVSTFEKKGRMSDAMDLLKKMVGIDPENVGIRLKIADSFHKQGFDKDALNEYSVIFSKLMAQGKADKAEKIYHTLLHIYPKEPQIFTGLCDIYRKKDDIAQYLKHARQLVNVYKNRGELDSAKAVAEDILTVKPDDAESLGLLSHFNVPLEKEKVEKVSKKSLLEAMDIHEDEEAPLIDFNLVAPEAGHAEEEAEKAKAEEAPLIEMPEFVSPPAPKEEALITLHEEAAPEKPSALPVEPEKPAEAAPEIEIELEGFEPAASGAGAPPAHEAELEISEIIEPVEAEPAEEAPPLTLEASEEHAEIHLAEEISEEEAVTLAPHAEEPAVAPVHEEAAAETPAYAAPSVAEEGMMEEGAGEGMDEFGEEEFVDLAAEIGIDDLGLEDIFKDMAESFGAGGDRATAEEFKSGIESQLGKEDAETHFNLGIAYMEMELFTEACKEFKIAVKDPHMEFECYTRLGLCYMSQAKPDEAITYYLKSLKVKNRGEEERKGAMYELATAYEAAENRDEAAELYRAIYALDPAYREVAEKAKEFGIEATAKEAEAGAGAGAPVDDGMLEVELL